MRIYLLIIFSLLSFFLFSQNNVNPNTKNAKSDNDFSSLNFDILSVSYSPATLISQKFALGVEVQGGLGLRISLNKPTYKYTENLDSTWAYNNINKLIEIIKIEPFISYSLTNFLNMSLGIYGSLNKIEYKHPSNFNFNVGAGYSLYYGVGKVMIGHKIQFGNVFIRYSNNTDANSNVFIILFTPLVLKINI